MLVTCHEYVKTIRQGETVTSPFTWTDDLLPLISYNSVYTLVYKKIVSPSSGQATLTNPQVTYSGNTFILSFDNFTAYNITSVTFYFTVILSCSAVNKWGNESNFFLNGTPFNDKYPLTPGLPWYVDEQYPTLVRATTNVFTSSDSWPAYTSVPNYKKNGSSLISIDAATRPLFGRFKKTFSGFVSGEGSRTIYISRTADGINIDSTIYRIGTDDLVAAPKNIIVFLQAAGGGGNTTGGGAGAFYAGIIKIPEVDQGYIGITLGTPGKGNDNTAATAGNNSYIRSFESGTVYDLVEVPGGTKGNVETDLPSISSEGTRLWTLHSQKGAKGRSNSSAASIYATNDKTNVLGVHYPDYYYQYLPSRNAGADGADDWDEGTVILGGPGGGGSCFAAGGAGGDGSSTSVSVVLSSPGSKGSGGGAGGTVAYGGKGSWGSRGGEAYLEIYF